MRSDRLSEITIKVPSPFAGVAGLGFSARYPEQPLLGPLRDVPEARRRRLEQLTFSFIGEGLS